MNTYQLGPLVEEEFVPSHMDKILAECVEEFFRDISGSAEVSGKSEEIARTLSEHVRTAVRTKGRIPRHKIIVQSHVEIDIGQSSCIASKCMWDGATDNFSSMVFRRGDLVATVLVFALYQH